MPNPRQILQEIDQNVRRKPKLTVGQRDAAVRMSVAGASLKEIADHFGRSPQGIGRLLKKHHSTGTTADEPRSGRPPVLSRHQKKLIYRAPKIEYSKLAEVAVILHPDGTPSKAPSYSTLYRSLKGHGLTNFRCIVRLTCTGAMLPNVCSSAGSTETSDGAGTRSSSQMSALFRRAQATIQSGAFDILGRNGRERW
jgi:transposase